MNANLDLSRILKTVNLFEGLNEETLQLLQARLRLRELQTGEILCREGEPGREMYLLESGTLSVLKASPEGHVELTVLHPGEVAGVMSLFGEAVRSATLQAREPCRVWALDHATFDALLEQHGALAKGVLRCLSRHLRRESSVVARLLSREVSGQLRVAFFDSKPYQEKVFRERNQGVAKLDFFEARLTRETVSMAAGYKAVCVFVNDQLDAEVIEELSGLGVELVALRCAGFNNVDLAACRQYGVSVVRVPAYSPYAVAEHAAALILSLNRRIPRAYQRVREGNFSLQGLVGFDLHGKTAGIIGTGKIGRCLLRILAGFGCRLLACDEAPDAQLAAQLGVQYVPLDQLFAESHIISLHVPLNPATRHLINEAAIAKMRPGVMLINTSRGALIDTRALLEGLKSGHIGWAGLDVYEEEADYFFEDRSDQVITDDVLARLLTFPNVIVTSHQAFLTQEALENIADITLESFREFEEGKRGRELTCAVVAG